jgi:hypothetical protein
MRFHHLVEVVYKVVEVLLINALVEMVGQTRVVVVVAVMVSEIKSLPMFQQEAAVAQD